MNSPVGGSVTFINNFYRKFDNNIKNVYGRSFNQLLGVMTVIEVLIEESSNFCCVTFK